MKAIVVGSVAESVVAAFEAAGIETAVIDGQGTGSSLRSAGLEDADLLVVTDVAEATAIPIAKDSRPDIRVVIYSEDSMPEFVRGQVDLAISPSLLEPEVVAEELAAEEPAGSP